jgi:hypothetical protein
MVQFMQALGAWDHAVATKSVHHPRIRYCGKGAARRAMAKREHESEDGPCRIFLGPRAPGLALTCALAFPPISLLPVRAGPVFSPRLSEQALPFLLPVRSSPASASACHPFLFDYSPYITSSDLISIFPLHFPFFSLCTRPSSCSYATAPVHL